MTNLTINDLLTRYRYLLSDRTYVDIFDLYIEDKLKPEKLQELLFNEEYDGYHDSSSEAKHRNPVSGKANGVGENPVNQEYVDSVNVKRVTLGVSPLAPNGTNPDDTSRMFCEALIENSPKHSELKKKKTVYVDMDNVLVNFQSGIDKISEEEKEKYAKDLDDVPGIFSLMEPYEGAIEGYKWLSENFDTYILSTAPWNNPTAWIDKLLWVKKYLPEVAYKRLIISHNKHLADGDFLIDDRVKNGAGEFKGKHIHFAEKGAGFEDWKAVIAYMKNLV